MAACAYCGSTVLFGGKKVQGRTFCSDKCLARGQVVLAADRIPQDVVDDHAKRIHAGACPVCKQNRGPVEVHTAHTVTSFLVMTQWASTPKIACQPCGRKGQILALVHSLFLGWWGFPWGLLMTPVQIGKNIAGMLKNGNTAEPSPQLANIVRMGLASQAATAVPRAGA